MEQKGNIPNQNDSELALLKQEIKAKEEMLSLKDELISELRDRVELMKKLADEKGS